MFGGIGVYAYVCRSPPELPQVHCADTERNRSIIAQCPVLTQPFEPTWWLSNKHLQSTAYVVVCAMARVDWAKVEPLATEDGGTVRLCWAEPPDEADARPTVLLLHGLTGNTRHLGPHIPKLMAAGFRVVGLDRRGHGHPLTSPKFSVFGDGRDVQLAVEAVHRQLPRSPIALLSLCAGGGPMLHYSVLEYERTKKVFSWSLGPSKPVLCPNPCNPVVARSGVLTPVGMLTIEIVLEAHCTLAVTLCPLCVRMAGGW